MQSKMRIVCAMAIALAAAGPLGATSVGLLHFDQTINVNGGTSQSLVTLNNANTAGADLIFIKGTINRTEASGGDSWLGIGINPTNIASAPANVTTGTGGHLVRTVTDNTGTHQLFDIDGTNRSTNAAAVFNQAVGASFVTSIRLGPGGIAVGQPAGISFQIDEGADTFIDRGLGGNFNWSSNNADIRIAAQSKDHVVDIEIVSLSLASVQPIQIFNTGVDNNGNALGDNVNDPHYDLIVDPSGLGDATVPNDGFPIPPWVANNAGSRWIGPADGNDANGPGGQYIYRTTFDLPIGAVLDTAFLSGFWGADDGGLTNASILLNGQLVPISHNGFGLLTPSAPAPGSPFQHGLNTLDFVLVNGGGPTGLRVDGLVGGFVNIPEPATATLGLMGLGLLARRRRRAA